MRRFALFLAPFVFVGAILGIWEAACRLLQLPSYLLPAPSAIAVALTQNAALLFVSAGRTLWTALTAFVMVSIAANLSALAAATSQLVERAFRPIAVALQVTPVVALAPLFQVWAGIEHPQTAVVALASIVGFFPIYSGTLSGLSAADPELERLFDLYGASAWSRLTRLRAPSAVPHALQGHKVGLGLALVGAVVGEMSAGSGDAQGLAWRIDEASRHLQMAESFAALFALVVMASALNVLYVAFERAALAWWRGR